MEEITALPSELIATPIKMALPIKIKEGISIINENPLGVLEKLGKYEFIYDYQVPNPFFNMYLKPSNTGIINDGASKNSSGFFNFDSDGTGGIKNIKPAEPLKPYVAYTVNPNPQVGTFSKGNIVNVLRFDGNNAIIQNPNFVEPDPTAVKTFWSGLMVDFKNQKEFSIPKDYLRKVDDTLAVTLSTGIQYGANIKPQPVYNYPIKTIPQITTLELNASYILNKDFNYVLQYKKLEEGIKLGASIPVFADLKVGTKVTGDLIRKPNNNMYRVMVGYPTPPPYSDFLQVKGIGADGYIEIPIENLTRLGISNNLITDNNTIVTVISLVDKKRGKCNPSLMEMQQQNYDPCRVSAVKGQTYNGYISGGSFYSIDGEAFLPMNEYKIVEENNVSGNNKNNGVVLPAEDNNKNLLMIVGAFLLGYVLFGKDTPTT
jgi:hypothetical protein